MRNITYTGNLLYLGDHNCKFISNRGMAYYLDTDSELFHVLRKTVNPGTYIRNLTFVVDMESEFVIDADMQTIRAHVEAPNRFGWPNSKTDKDWDF